MRETEVWSLGGEDPLEEEVATHSSILAWEIPWTEAPGGLQSMGLQKCQTWLSDWTTKMFREAVAREDRGRVGNLSTFHSVNLKLLQE